jgi:hypothetical protein
MDIQADVCMLEHSWNLQISNVALPVRRVWQATHVLLEKEVPAQTGLPHIVYPKASGASMPSVLRFDSCGLN